MAVEIERACKQGFLWLPPHGQLKKAWQKKYCQLYRASKEGLERLEVFDNEEEASRSIALPIITLDNCVKITQDPQKSQPFSFTVVTKTDVHHLAGTTHEDMLDWMSVFQAVAFKDTVSRQTIEEDNDLYCSSGDAGVFVVKLVSSDASERCGLKAGEYTLVVAPAELQLRLDHVTLLTWPYRYIRRYGHRSGKFMFEAGRKCASGEGSFYVQHSNQQEIFRCMTAKMRHIKSLLSSGGDSLVCGEGQLQHALGMTARSRSPLPPSPTSATPRPVPPPPPVLPSKPPRKHPPSTQPKQYDTVQLRSDAWKTHGLNNVTHTERPHSPTKVFTQPASVNNYDRLQHFGSRAKLGGGGVYREVRVGGGIEVARWADDSHRGYGVIRKKAEPPVLLCKPHVV